MGTSPAKCPIEMTQDQEITIKKTSKTFYANKEYLAKKKVDNSYGTSVINTYSDRYSYATL